MPHCLDCDVLVSMYDVQQLCPKCAALRTTILSKLLQEVRQARMQLQTAMDKASQASDSDRKESLIETQRSYDAACKKLIQALSAYSAAGGPLKLTD